jgi:hypothetical protein
LVFVQSNLESDGSYKDMIEGMGKIIQQVANKLYHAEVWRTIPLLFSAFSFWTVAANLEIFNFRFILGHSNSAKYGRIQDNITAVRCEDV